MQVQIRFCFTEVNAGSRDKILRVGYVGAMSQVNGDVYLPTVILIEPKQLIGPIKGRLLVMFGRFEVPGLFVNEDI